eukprot:TRINITY_DN1407_c5_g1_i1.p1 TRINITY_DN1407_c5_g1~~TRINITY_DN1407_c5_g1_i1.p1  ORF type:complete len:300 (+),score=45.26 TRINITY_DN1407_c5_g1_i1:91-990(+)
MGALFSRKRRASLECKDFDQTLKRSRLSYQFLPDDHTEATEIEVRLGLSGELATCIVEPQTSLLELEAQLKDKAEPTSEQLTSSLRFSADGELLESTEALLRCYKEGKEIYATWFRSVDDMDLDEVSQNLSLTDEEFKGHLFTLSKLAPSGEPTARDVAHYLWDNQLLLNPMQAAQVFDALIPRLGLVSRSRYSKRGQLIVALQSFCTEPYAIWELDDGHDQCLWANMDWGASQPWHSGLAYVTRGSSRNLPPKPASQAAARKDISHLREVLRSRWAGKAEPLNEIRTLTAYDTSWRSW